ncbi:NAD(P)/FAD-dependent oxidoreductase [Pseudomonas sp.]|uniref:flavin-containing monooxygenase n=1 Tax=Pseudomonas sp. TaxID=306 RepID=UPI0019EBDB86|nr:NAD(P)/FAD-dependent oxidoreductase [Pseudomonas sp.]MBF0674687.1 NAD(P)/FAD-dependent oxidoreductase [Pseudomonas sp.]
MHDDSRSSAPLRVLIIGAGFGGLGLAIQLRKAGIEDFLILEKADEVGGTWRDNHYPGAACDAPSHLYSFSFAPKLDWSRVFAPQAEIFAYQRQLADDHGLRGSIRFGCEVSEAAFDSPSGHWQVRCTNGETFHTQALVSACGQLNRPAYPQIPGLERFAGARFHSARWDHQVDLRGKRVAVIGTGASAIQFVPQIQPQVAKLSLFQRSAAYVLAKPDRAYRPWELALMRRVPWVQRIDRALKYLQHESRALAFVSFPALLKLFYVSFRRNLMRGVGDPIRRLHLTPDYPMGCKRILMANDYYPALAQGNVEIVTTGIREVTERGLVTVDGREHELDAIIYGTGFAATDFLAPMRITGLEGQELNSAWRDGAEAYKGVSVSGFPNLFILYGPNTNLGHNSILYMLESQFRYVLGCLQTLHRDGLRYLDVKPAAQQRFNQSVEHGLSRTVWAQGCHSWYQNAAGRNTNNWPGYTFAYRYRTRLPELHDYDCIR